MSKKGNKKDSLGDRMKRYESCSNIHLPRRMPVIIRLDGKAFHTLTRTLDKPYDTDFSNLMMMTAKYLVGNVMNCKLAYVQSDEISLVLIDYGTIETEAWFNNDVEKMVSISASMATAKFNSMLNNPDIFPKEKRDKIKQEFAMFDSRAYAVPREDVANYFIWRQQDATRNSIQGLGQKYFSQKQLNGKSCNVIQDMVMVEHNRNWNDVDTYFKRGGAIYRGVKSYRDVVTPTQLNPVDWSVTEGAPYPTMKFHSDIIVDYDMPILTQDRQYIECHLYPTEEPKLDKFVSSMLAREGINLASEILEGSEPNKPSMEQIGTILIDTANKFMDTEDEDE